MTIEVTPTNSANNWESRAIKEAVLKSAENLHLDPVSFAVQLMRAFDEIDGHYCAKSKIGSVQITPGEFTFMGEIGNANNN